MLNFSDNFFKKIEKKTSVDKDTIIGLAKKLQSSNLKDEATLREVIKQLDKCNFSRSFSKVKRNTATSE